MKKLNIVLAGVLVFAAAAAVIADVEITSPTIAVDEFTPSGGMTFKDAVKTSLDNIKSSIDEVKAVVYVQVDTNATTTATAYTPTSQGNILLGGAGTGTNAVWISKGTTTNDWVQVAP